MFGKRLISRHIYSPFHLLSPASGFCSSNQVQKVVSFEKANTFLNKVASNELQYENENYEAVWDAEDFLKESGFKLIEGDNDIFVWL